MSVRTEPNPSRGSRSLVTTLAIAFVLLSVTPLLLISGLLSDFGFQIQREAVFYQQRLTAAEAATEVSGFIEQIFSKLEASAQVGQVSNQEEQQLILEKLLGLEDALRELILVDAARPHDQFCCRVHDLPFSYSGVLAPQYDDPLSLGFDFANHK